MTDRRCAASDTLATSYILSCAVKKLDYDIVLCGRQAIDGDTAQVGPQLAEKLGLTQITYVELLETLEDKTITVRRNIGNGWQRVKSPLPVLLTVTGEANAPRVAAAKQLMKYKKARTALEVAEEIKAMNPDAAEAELVELVASRCDALDAKGDAHQALGSGLSPSRSDLVRAASGFAHQGPSDSECSPRGQGIQGGRTDRRGDFRHDPRIDSGQDHRLATEARRCDRADGPLTLTS